MLERFYNSEIAIEIGTNYYKLLDIVGGTVGNVSEKNNYLYWGEEANDGFTIGYPLTYAFDEVVSSERFIRTVQKENEIELAKIDTFSTSMGRCVRIYYAEPNSNARGLSGLANGRVENIGGNKVWIRNKNNCLECYGFQDILQMTEKKCK